MQFSESSEKVNNFDDLTLITCSYNTPMITINMLKSFVFNNGPGLFKLILVENSTNPETQELLKQNNVPFIVQDKSASKCHGPSLNFAFSICKTDYALIVDTDILFKKSIYGIFKFLKSGKILAIGKVSGNRGGKWIYPRLDPWFFFVNMKLIKQHNIKFYNYMKNNGLIFYDVGSSFCQDLAKLARLQNYNVLSLNDLDEYFIHFEGMSWRVNRYSDDNKEIGDIDIDDKAKHNDKILYKIGQEILVKYTESVANAPFKDVDISKSFIFGG